MHCDCHIRPLSHFLATQTEPAPFYQRVECETPKHVAGRKLIEAPDEYLSCNYGNATETQQPTADGNIDFDILPDIRFRDIA